MTRLLTSPIDRQDAPAAPLLALGLSAVPPGTLAMVVICLEMTSRPDVGARPTADGLALTRLDCSATDQYRALFRAVGQDWLWSSRLALSDTELHAVLHDPAVEAYCLARDGTPAGLLELDFRVAGMCELAFLGLVHGAVGTGAGRYLMAEALRLAWRRPIGRLWVRTCNLDHPRALSFYRRAGFRPYASMVEVKPDPRLNGLLSPEAAAHVPLFAPSWGSSPRQMADPIENGGAPSHLTSVRAAPE